MVAEDVSAGAGVGASKSLQYQSQGLASWYLDVHKRDADQGGYPDAGSLERYKDAA